MSDMIDPVMPEQHDEWQSDDDTWLADLNAYLDACDVVETIGTEDEFWEIDDEEYDDEV